MAAFHLEIEVAGLKSMFQEYVAPTVQKNLFSAPPSWVLLRMKSWDPREYYEKSGIGFNDPRQVANSHVSSSAPQTSLAEVPVEERREEYYKLVEDCDKEGYNPPLGAENCMGTSLIS